MGAEITGRDDSRGRQGLRDIWNGALRERRFLVEGFLTFPIAAGILSVCAQIWLYVEERVGIHVFDPLLDALPPLTLSVPIFITIWGATALSVGVMVRYPKAFMRGFQAVAVMFILRAIALTSTPLEPPPTMIPLHDPVVVALGTTKVLCKDLYFSGHTATTFIMFLILPMSLYKRIVGACVALIAMGVILQHAHLTIDVFVAPFFAFAAVRIVAALHRGDPTPLSPPARVVNVPATWKAALEDPVFRRRMLQALVSLGVLSTTLVALFFHEALRAQVPRPILPDPVLGWAHWNATPGILLFLSGAALLYGLLTLMTRPGAMLVALVAATCLMTLRIGALLFLPLAPPEGAFVLSERLLRLVTGYEGVVAADSFFSMAVALLTVVALMSPGKKSRLALFVCALVSAGLLVGQHQQYFTSVYSAVVFAYGCVHLALWMLDGRASDYLQRQRDSDPVG